MHWYLPQVMNRTKQRRKSQSIGPHVRSVGAWGRKDYDVATNCEDMGMIYNIPVDKDYIPPGLEYEDEEVEESTETDSRASRSYQRPLFPN